MPGRPRRLGAALAATLLVATAAACSSDPEPSDAAFCERLAPVADLDDQLATAPAELGEDLDGLRAAAAVAPPAVAGDVEVLVDALEQLADAAASSPEDPDGAVRDALVGLQGELDRLEAASSSVAAYAAERCGVQLGTPPGSAPGTTGAAG